VAALQWNGWQHSSGIGGIFEPEYARGCFSEISKQFCTVIDDGFQWNMLYVFINQ
jgi:hypothetical protein